MLSAALLRASEVQHRGPTAHPRLGPPLTHTRPAPLPPVSHQVGSEIVLSIAGNKSDLDRHRVVPRQEAADYAASVGAHYAETSAKTGRGINELFGVMARKLLETRKLTAGAPAGGGNVFVVDDEPAPRSSGCC